jgi:integral membrane protein
MAWLVGVLLIVLVFVGMPLKYLTVPGSDLQAAGASTTSIVGVLHGFLYMVYLVTAAQLAFLAKWKPLFIITTMAAGLIPVFTFLAERRATAAVRAAQSAAAPVR